jgi:membrane-bound serine protease (ClpP class)
MCAELFIPGGIVGLIGGALIVVSIVSAFSVWGVFGGGCLLTGAFIFGTIALYISIKYLPKSYMGRIMFLSKTEKHFASSGDYSEYVGKEGITKTRLRPSGKVIIENKVLDVVTDGIYLRKGEKIKVMEVEGSRVVVKRI